MARKEISQNEFIAHGVAEATRVAIQTMATTGMARQENAGTKISGPILKWTYSIGEQRTSMKM